jgi:hypothetical protein
VRGGEEEDETKGRKGEVREVELTFNKIFGVWKTLSSFSFWRKSGKSVRRSEK